MSHLPKKIHQAPLSSATAPVADHQSISADVPADHSESAVLNPLPWWKRAIDLAACVIILPVLGVCTLAMTLLTRLLSPGPVLFVQERVGYRGRRFMLYKFRTMRVGVDRSAHENYCRDLMNSNAPMTKLDARGDARLIPGAWLLRASGLDELPQIINVLRGEMSLVGPRPCLPAEFEIYQPAQRRRCDTLPGLTGLWQVSGKNRTTFDEMISLDIRYGRELSLWNEVAIIFLTVPSLVRQVSDTSHARKSPEILAAVPGVVVPPSALAESPTQ